MVFPAITRSELVYRAPAREVAQSVKENNEPKEIMLEARLPSVSLTDIVRSGRTIAEIHKANNELYLMDIVEGLIQRMFYKSGTERR